MKRASARPRTSVAPPRATGRSRPAHARFWRCALQVNPFSYSKAYRGKDHQLDEDQYNAALAAECLALEVQVVGIADHGSVDAVDKLRETLCSKGLVVFPGFEIASTEKVHMVCLFPESTTKDQLNRYLGKLDLTHVDDGVRPSTLGCLALAQRIDELGGFWFAAHITGANGLLRLGSKDGGGLTHVWTDSARVRVAQIPGSIEELPESYQKIIRNETPEYWRERPIVVINAKDVASPKDLRDEGASTWLKMTEPNFDAFKVAFLDPGSRVRLSLEEAPHSSLVALRVQGGYLNGLEARFSQHLNALIGGRGTGKSTLLEFIRYALELSPKGRQALKLHQEILKENLGKASGTIELEVCSMAQHHASFTVSRRFGEPPIVRDSQGAVSRLQPKDLLPGIDIYGQNEIFELAQDSLSRVRLLERFLPQDLAAAETRAQLRKRLADNTERLLKAEAERDHVAEQVLRLPKLQEQLEGFRKLGIEAKLAKVPLYAREKQLIFRVEEDLSQLEGAIVVLREALPDATYLNDKVLEPLPHRAEFTPVREMLEHVRADIEAQLSLLENVLVRARTDLTTHRGAWRLKLEAGEKELDVALSGIADMAGKSGREVGTAFKELSQQIERIQPLNAKVATYDQLIATLEKERQELIGNLSALRSRRSTELQTAVTRLNDRLRGKLRVKLGVEGGRSRLRDFLLACKLDGVGEKRLSWVDEQGVTPLALARAISAGAEQLSKAFSLTPGVAAALSKIPRERLLALESIELEDEVEIELNVAHGDKENYRKLEQLSTGQQCTAVLHLLLLENTDPLLVDQPEDNLDNAFIAERIVQELRASKTERQFLFATHNANIPVFGDAEWIGVISAEDRRGVLPPENQGSIDVPAIREQAAEILEGGPSAFHRRKEMYGF